MGNVLELKGKIQKLYAEYSFYIDKVIRFVLAFVTFFMIGREIGFLSLAKNPVVLLALSVICAFLPPSFIVLAAAALVLAHVYAASLGILIVTVILFFLMFVFYIRMAPKTAIVVVLAALAFMLKIPAAVPVGFALVATPVYAVPVSCGVISYYMIQQVKETASAGQVSDSAGFIGDMTEYVKAVLQNKEMWIFVIASVVCVLVVYAVKRMGIVHAWKVASVAGAIVYLLTAAIGDMAAGVKISYGPVVFGGIAAIIIGLILELFFFAVDYAKSENFQYEDDEYYYYVKAVPKVGIAAPEKTVKRISRREEAHTETEIIDSGELRKKIKRPEKLVGKKRVRNEKNVTGKATENTDHMLLTQSLEQELSLNKKKKS